MTSTQAQFQPGDMITFSQLPDQWGNPAHAAGVLLNAQYDFVYFPTGGVLEVGIIGAGGSSMAFTNAGALLTYLPAIGTPGPLTGDLVDPHTSPSGAFGGEVVTLKLNVDFSDAGHTLGALGIAFGNLVIHDYAGIAQVNGLTLRQFLGDVNLLLGGGAIGYSLGDAYLLVVQINVSFGEGQPTQWAQEHLMLPCYPDCNGDTVLTVADFGCFQTRFVAGNLYADCTGEGLLTVADFGCFQTAFVAGCP